MSTKSLKLLPFKLNIFISKKLRSSASIRGTLCKKVFGK
jgi:hypothetical protein